MQISYLDEGEVQSWLAWRSLGDVGLLEVGCGQRSVLFMKWVDEEENGKMTGLSDGVDERCRWVRKKVGCWL